jgi:alkylation response protein AidB-like acyl-CoA dehydrogenase
MADKETTSFMRSLCMGVIEEDVVLPFPVMGDREGETLKEVFGALKQFLGDRDKDYRAWDVAGELPEEILKELRQFGLFGLVLPEDAGGLGMGSTAYSRTLQELSRYDGSVAATVGAHSSIGLRGLLIFGTAEQRKRFYPKLATGEMIAAFCLTEPGAGSDAASIKTTAVRDGDDWVLDGSKLWITNGGLASFFTVFAKTGKADERGKLTAFIVTRDMKGVSVGPHEDKMGLRASSTTAVFLDGVRVPAANVLGEVGKGFKVAMRILNSGRSGLGGGCVGGMKRMIELATRQAKGRVQFGKPIAEFGLIKQKIGHMVVETYAAESAVAMVAGLVDQGYQDYAVEAAISKVFATEALWRTTDEALQIAGGNGYMREYPYERALRDCRIFRIWEGTNDILRLFIALTAMNDVGAQLADLAASLKDVLNEPIKGFGVLSEYALRRASLVTNVGRDRGTFTRLSAVLKDEADAFAEHTRDLATAADRILRKHGKRIADMQFATRRLADIMIDLFLMACVLSRVDGSVKRLGEEGAAKELEILRVLAGQVQRRVRSNYGEIDDNDDELIKSLADHAFAEEGFSWDNLPS